VIRRIFDRFGTIVNVTIGAKDFAFLEYVDTESCKLAVKYMHLTNFDEHSTKPMHVRMALNERVAGRGEHSSETRYKERYSVKYRTAPQLGFMEILTPYTHTTEGTPTGLVCALHKETNTSGQVVRGVRGM